MKTMEKNHTVSEGLVLLKQKYFEYAPQNEETLRRAIRSGKLKAQLRRGREGSVIGEKDLLEYGEKYAARRQLLGGGFAAKASALAVPDQGLVRYVDLMQEAMETGEAKEWAFKLRLIEARNRWTERESRLKEQIQKLQAEAEQCRREEGLFDQEIMKRT